jgi:hypothetical protein
VDLTTLSRRRHLLSSSAIFLVTLFGTYLFWAGFTPWVIYAEVFILTFLALSVHMRALLALSFSLLGNLALYSVFIQLSPLFPGSLSTKTFVLSLVLISLSTLVVCRNSRHIPSERLRIWLTSHKLVFSLFAGLVIFFIFQCINGPFNAHWAMNNDAVWNTVSTRFLIQDGGVDTNVRPNASPLTAGILSAATSPGRELVLGSTLLAHDISLQSQTWSAVVIFSALVAGIFASTSLSKKNSLIRTVGISGSMVLPLTWFYSGYAVQFGFYNASLATLILLTIWIVWINHHLDPALSFLSLCLGSIAILATWAPLVLVPGLLIFFLILRHWKVLWGDPRSTVISMVGVCALVGYALFFSLRDLLKEGGALSVDGGIFGFQPMQYALIIVSALLISILVFHTTKQNEDFIGIALVVIAGAIGTGFLAYQRQGSESLWGYYPVKFAWLIATLLIVVLLVGFVNLASNFAFSPFIKTTYVFLSGGFVLLLMSLSGVPSIINFITPVGIALDRSSNSQSQFLKELSELSSENEKTMVVNFGESTQEDLSYNNWLLQINSKSSKDPIRWFSYFLDGTDLSMVCEASTVWGDNVTIHTRNPSLEQSLADVCPSNSARFVVHG